MPSPKPHIPPVPHRHAWIASAINAALSGLILVLLIPLYLEFVPLAQRLKLTVDLRRVFTGVILASALYLLLRFLGHTRRAVTLYRRARSAPGRL